MSSAHDSLLNLAERLGGGPVEVKETHISRVALAGQPGAGGVVLKQCKPVDFGFVDLRTREQRRAALEKECAVNARFAPGVYRGVRELSDGEPVLEMQRLDEADTLEAKVKRGDATTADLDAVLDHLLPLFEASKRTPRWGDPAIIRQNLTENADALRATERRTGETLYAADLKAVQLSFLALHEDQLRARSADGFVRDGHGDLRAEHVYITDEGVKVLDGIAFSDRLRCVDVADEFAFLAYSLDVLRRDDPAAGGPYGQRLLTRYRERTGDPISDDLWFLYVSYRAAVRCKVRALSLPDSPTLAEIDALREQVALEPLRYAQRFAERSMLVVIAGLSGSGKSTLAGAVADRIGGPHFRSDLIRKKLHGVAPRAAIPPSDYTAERADAVYQRLVREAAGFAEERGAAVADATFATPAHRARLLQTCGHAVLTLFVWCECSDAVAEARIQRRVTEGTDASDATVAVRRRQAVGLDEPNEQEFAALPNVSLLRLNTDAPLDALVDRVIDALRQLAQTAARVAASGDVP